MCVCPSGLHYELACSTILTQHGNIFAMDKLCDPTDKFGVTNLNFTNLQNELIVDDLDEGYMTANNEEPIPDDIG